MEKMLGCVGVEWCLVIGSVILCFSSDLQLYHSETLELMLQRWSKLERDFRMKNGRYDISKIPDIYDCIKYDTQHNASLSLEDTLELFRLSRALADIVIPQVRPDGHKWWTNLYWFMEVQLHSATGLIEQSYVNAGKYLCICTNKVWPI